MAQIASKIFASSQNELKNRKTANLAAFAGR